MTIPWIQATEPVVGENHPDGLTDIANRAPRFIVSTSGLGDDGSWDGGSFPGFIPNFVGAGSPEAVITATVGKFYHDSTNNKLYYKLTGSGNTGWIEIVTSGAVAENTFYVGKHGSDTNSGKNIGSAFLTFSAAITASSTGDVIVCLDSGVYTEAVNLGNRSLFAPHATIAGPAGSGITALNIVGFNININVGRITQTGGGGGARNTGLSIAQTGNVRQNEPPFVQIGSIFVTGPNVTAVGPALIGSLTVGTIRVEEADNSIGINTPGGASSSVKLDIGEIFIRTSAVATADPIGIRLTSSAVQGSIGRIELNYSTLPGTAIYCPFSAGAADLHPSLDINFIRIDSLGATAILADNGAGIIVLRIGGAIVENVFMNLNGGFFSLILGEVNGEWNVSSPATLRINKAWELVGLGVGPNPNITGKSLTKTSSTTAITDLDKGIIGQVITIKAAHTITITHNASIQLQGSVNFNMVSGDVLVLGMFDNQVWDEVSRKTQ